ncbi:hypothetical protein [Mesonia sp.]|uniref:hypothetical protein n=1 Tax=Mesonia sp. TaxID=1960830 RepID=UPI003F965B39
MEEVKATFSRKSIDKALKELIPEKSVEIESLILNNGVREERIIDSNPNANDEEEKSGVYIFWWDLSKSKFIESDKRILIEKVPKKSLKIKVTAQVTDEWIEAATFDKKICYMWVKQPIYVTA